MTRGQSFAFILGLFSFFLLVSANAHAASVTADMRLATASGEGKPIGTVTIADEENGIVIITALQDLPPGERGFHVHEKPDCGPALKDGVMTPSLAAGGHYDPDKTGKHLGPEGGGHKGDLPRLMVAPDGTARVTLHVKGVTAAELKDRAIMIHEGGDNYSDKPAAFGGGGARIACGILR